MISITKLKDLSLTQSLYADCSCGRGAIKLDTKVLISALGENLLLSDVANKAKCKVCGSRFSSIQLVSQTHVLP